MVALLIFYNSIINRKKILCSIRDHSIHTIFLHCKQWWIQRMAKECRGDFSSGGSPSVITTNKRCRFGNIYKVPPPKIERCFEVVLWRFKVNAHPRLDLFYQHSSIELENIKFNLQDDRIALSVDLKTKLLFF